MPDDIRDDDDEDRIDDREVTLSVDEALRLSRIGGGGSSSKHSPNDRTAH